MDSCALWQKTGEFDPECKSLALIYPKIDFTFTKNGLSRAQQLKTCTSISVEWPTCLKPVANTAIGTLKFSNTTDSFETCFTSCKAVSLAECAYWTYNFTNNLCQFFTVLKASENTTDVLSGEKYCTGKCNYVALIYLCADKAR